MRENSVERPVRRLFVEFLRDEGQTSADLYEGLSDSVFSRSAVDAALKFVNGPITRCFYYPTITHEYYVREPDLELEYHYCDECGHYHSYEAWDLSGGKCPFLMEELAVAYLNGLLLCCDECKSYYGRMSWCKC